jgi:DNA polymerase delta subunit 1
MTPPRPSSLAPPPPIQGHFPEAQLDPVIQIASMVTVQGEKGPRVKNVLTLGTCAPIVGSEVMSFESEADMLK